LGPERGWWKKQRKKKVEVAPSKKEKTFTKRFINIRFTLPFLIPSTPFYFSPIFSTLFILGIQMTFCPKMNEI